MNGSQDVRKLVTAIKPAGSQRRALTESIVEDAAAAANDSLRRTRRIGCSRRPGKAHARSKIEFAGDVGLVLVTQAVAEGKIWTQAPIVLPIESEVRLRD